MSHACERGNAMSTMGNVLQLSASNNGSLNPTEELSLLAEERFSVLWPLKALL